MTRQPADAGVVRRAIRTITGDPLVAHDREDDVAVEQPLQILINGAAFRQTSRTPGHDDYLVAGLLAAEGLIRSAADPFELAWAGPNEVDVRLGTDQIDAPSAQDTQRSVAQVETTIAVTDLLRLPTELRALQAAFRSTGATHAVGLFTPQATPLAVFEDIGRHNAFDKVLGWALRNDRWPASDGVVFVSGRQSADLVQKAVMAGVGIVGGVSAPTSLAVDLATASGLTLCGFVRPGYVNVYSHPWRVRDVALADQQQA